MKLLVAITLVVISMASAEPPSRLLYQRQTAAPYQARGWRPNGPAFNPTSNLQRQEQAPAEPSASYGPPPSASYGPPESEVTTTEAPTTTEAAIEATTFDFQGEELKSGLLRRDQKSEKLQTAPQQPRQVYVVLPQGNFLYTTAVRPEKAVLVQAADPNKEVEVVKEPKLAPVQAIPALAKIQAPVLVAKYEQAPQVVPLQQIQAVPYARYVTYLSRSQIHTPYSDSFVQIYQ